MKELLQQARDRGLLINNLFQLDDGSWQANVRTPDMTFHEFGRGPTIESALREALGAKVSKRVVKTDLEDLI